MQPVWHILFRVPDLQQATCGSLTSREVIEKGAFSQLRQRHSGGHAWAQLLLIPSFSALSERYFSPGPNIFKKFA
jgi:hypothetical protein